MNDTLMLIVIFGLLFSLLLLLRFSPSHESHNTLPNPAQRELDKHNAYQKVYGGYELTDDEKRLLGLSDAELEALVKRYNPFALGYFTVSEPKTEGESDE